MTDIRVIEVLRLGRSIKTKLSKIRFKEGDQLLFKSHVSGVMDVSQTQGLALGAKPNSASLPS